MRHADLLEDATALELGNEFLGICEELHASQYGLSYDEEHEGLSTIITAMRASEVTPVVASNPSATELREAYARFGERIVTHLDAVGKANEAETARYKVAQMSFSTFLSGHDEAPIAVSIKTRGDKVIYRPNNIFPYAGQIGGYLVSSWANFGPPQFGARAHRFPPSKRPNFVNYRIRPLNSEGKPVVSIGIGS